MSRRILDTNLLVAHWRMSWRELRKKEPTPVLARRWAQQLIHLRQTEWIELPVRLEFLAGRRTEEPIEVVQAYLGEFALADEGIVLPDDWRGAENYANRILSNRPRDLGDCLILAIADRLGFDIDTFDGGMPRSSTHRDQAKARKQRKRRKKR